MPEKVLQEQMEALDTMVGYSSLYVVPPYTLVNKLAFLYEAPIVSFCYCREQKLSRTMLLMQDDRYTLPSPMG